MIENLKPINDLQLKNMNLHFEKLRTILQESAVVLDDDRFKLIADDLDILRKKSIERFLPGLFDND